MLPGSVEVSELGLQLLCVLGLLAVKEGEEQTYKKVFRLHLDCAASKQPKETAVLGEDYEDPVICRVRGETQNVKSCPPESQIRLKCKHKGRTRLPKNETQYIQVFKWSEYMYFMPFNRLLLIF